MNIAYIVPALTNRGPVIVAKELAEQFVNHKHNCSVFYFDDKTELDFPCPVKRISPNEKINFSKFDIVHSHSMRPDKYVYKHREFGGQTKYISTMHSYLIDDLKYQYNWLTGVVFGNLWIRLWLSRHDKLVALSRNALEYYRRYFSDEKLTYAYNTRNPDVSKTLTQDEIDELMRFKQNDVLIGVNALLTYIKGVDILIKAMPELPGRKLFIAGAGKSQKNLERLAINCGVKDRCFFAGYRKDAYRYLPFYDIFALPSRVEGFPLALLEAAVYKRPCVVSDIHIFKEVLDEKSAAMFPLEQPAKIAEAVRLAEKTPALGENLYRKYKDSFSPEQMYMQYLEIYNNARGDL